jgi:hypothetical protein
VSTELTSLHKGSALAETLKTQSYHYRRHDSSLFMHVKVGQSEV